MISRRTWLSGMLASLLPWKRCKCEHVEWDYGNQCCSTCGVTMAQLVARGEYPPPKMQSFEDWYLSRPMPESWCLSYRRAIDAMEKTMLENPYHASTFNGIEDVLRLYEDKPSLTERLKNVS